MDSKQLKDFLDEQYLHYQSLDFIALDPIKIPHHYSRKEDIEISGFLAATIAWGQRVTIVNNAARLMELMEDAPYDFIKNHQPQDLKRFSGFKHRTFNFDDLLFFFSSLQNIYLQHGGLEKAFAMNAGEENTKDAISRFRGKFFEVPHLLRSQKHVSDPYRNSACKRLNMFLRWMVRKDLVDFGIWKHHSTAQLSCPLDVHSGKVARKLGMLQRKQNDWKAVEELDAWLRQLDPQDPVKYDLALFAMGVDGK